MNVIPKINGRVLDHKGHLTVALPLSYQGTLLKDFYALRFGLMPSSSAQLQLSQDDRIAPQGYRLLVSEDGIELDCSDEAGQFYGLATLSQLLSDGSSGLFGMNTRISPCEIEDAPAQQIRSFCLDLSQQSFGEEEIEKILEQMGFLKLNSLLLILPSQADAENGRLEAFAKDRCISLKVSQERDASSSWEAAAETGDGQEDLERKVFPLLEEAAEQSWNALPLPFTPDTEFLSRVRRYERELEELGIGHGSL